MNEVEKYIESKSLINKNEVIGVAVSGGSDSIALLDFLNKLSKQNKFEIIAIHIDHMLRETSKRDSDFVVDFCKKNLIKAHCFKVDAGKLANENKISIEMAARQARYGVFEALVKKKIVNKIALAHHKNDQIETILLNLFRGTGVSGIKGMEPIRDCFIRPFLEVDKSEILNYLKENNLEYMQDETNEQTNYQRNYIRHQILPLITEKWTGAINSIINFSSDVSQDDDYIKSKLNLDGVIYEEKMAKVPTSYFLQENALVSRMIFKVLKNIDVIKDIERKHIAIIKNFALRSDTGKKLDLPFKLSLVKEYDYIVFVNKLKEKPVFNQPFKIGKVNVNEMLQFKVKKISVEKFIKTENNLLLDIAKLPKDAVWRFKEIGDNFKKFGGGSKSLKSYLVDKKIPSRLRQNLPVLASKSEIYAILGVEISDLVKVDYDTKSAVEITII